MEEAKTLLQHPMWEYPRPFSPEHARNILEREKTYPSGITLFVEQKQQLDAANDSENTGNSNEQGKQIKAGNTKSRKARK